MCVLVTVVVPTVAVAVASLVLTRFFQPVPFRCIVRIENTPFVAALSKMPPDTSWLESLLWLKRFEFGFTWKQATNGVVLAVLPCPKYTPVSDDLTTAKMVY